MSLQDESQQPAIQAARPDFYARLMATARFAVPELQVPQSLERETQDTGLEFSQSYDPRSLQQNGRPPVPPDAPSPDAPPPAREPDTSGAVDGAAAGGSRETAGRGPEEGEAHGGAQDAAAGTSRGKRAESSPDDIPEGGSTSPDDAPDLPSPSESPVSSPKERPQPAATPPRAGLAVAPALSAASAKLGTPTNPIARQLISPLKHAQTLSPSKRPAPPPPTIARSAPVVPPRPPSPPDAPSSDSFAGDVTRDLPSHQRFAVVMNRGASRAQQPATQAPVDQRAYLEDSLESHSSDDPRNAWLNWGPQQVVAPVSGPADTPSSPKSSLQPRLSSPRAASPPRESATLLNTQHATSPEKASSAASATQLDSPTGFHKLMPSTGGDGSPSSLFSRQASGEIFESLAGASQPRFAATQLAIPFSPRGADGPANVTTPSKQRHNSFRGFQHSPTKARAQGEVSDSRVPTLPKHRMLSRTSYTASSAGSKHDSARLGQSGSHLFVSHAQADGSPTPGSSTKARSESGPTIPPHRMLQRSSHTASAHDQDEHTFSDGRAVHDNTDQSVSARGPPTAGDDGNGTLIETVIDKADAPPASLPDPLLLEARPRATRQSEPARPASPTPPFSTAPQNPAASSPPSAPAPPAEPDSSRPGPVRSPVTYGRRQPRNSKRRLSSSAELSDGTSSDEAIDPTDESFRPAPKRSRALGAKRAKLVKAPASKPALPAPTTTSAKPKRTKSTPGAANGQASRSRQVKSTSRSTRGTPAHTSSTPEADDPADNTYRPSPVAADQVERPSTSPPQAAAPAESAQGLRVFALWPYIDAYCVGTVVSRSPSGYKVDYDDGARRTALADELRLLRLHKSEPVRSARRLVKASVAANWPGDGDKVAVVNSGQKEFKLTTSELAVDESIVKAHFADRIIPPAVLDTVPLASIPPAPHGTFSGKTFLVSNCTSNDHEQSRVVALIKKHGGQVSDKWESLVDASGRLKTPLAPFVICIGSLAKRQGTPAKIIVGLAVGMPVVQHQWVDDVLAFGARWDSYLVGFQSKLQPDLHLSQVVDRQWGAEGWSSTTARAAHIAFDGKQIAFLTPLSKTYALNKVLIPLCLKALGAQVELLNDGSADITDYAAVIVEDRDKARIIPDELADSPKTGNVAWLLECLVRGMIIPPRFL